MAKIEILSPEGLRIDGRKPSELKRISSNLSISPQAEGSSYVECGNTKIMALVFGPREVSRKRNLQHQKCTICVNFKMSAFGQMNNRHRSGKSDKKSLEISKFIEQTFETVVITEKMPCSQIDILVDVLQADGSVLSAAINAVMLAIIDAGIPVHDTMTAITVALKDEVCLIEPNKIEESTRLPLLTLCAFNRNQSIVSSTVCVFFCINILVYW